MLFPYVLFILTKRIKSLTVYLKRDMLITKNWQSPTFKSEDFGERGLSLISGFTPCGEPWGT